MTNMETTVPDSDHQALQHPIRNGMNADHISENLAFRDSVDDLFSYIASLEGTNILIDFLGIQSITGSFAHQYIINKKKKEEEN